MRNFVKKKNMKKYFILYFILLSLSLNLFSQNIQLFNSQDVALQYGDTIKVYGSPQTSEIIAYVKVKNITSSVVEVICRKWVISATSGTQNVFCWANLCYPPHINESQTMNISPNTTVNDFSGHFFPNNIASEALIMYTFDVRNGDSAWIFIKFDATGQSISANSLTKLYKPYPNPASKEINIPFTLQAGQVGLIELYDILGKKHLSLKVKSNSNSIAIPVTSLNDGIYFVQLLVNDKIVGTEKCIVKK